MHTTIVSISAEMKSRLKRVNNLTPRSYLELLNLFKKIYGEKSQESQQMIQRLEDGYSKLMSANSQVDQLRADLIQQEPQLKEAEVQVQQLLSQITADRAKEQETKVLVAREEAEASKQQKEANELKQTAEDSVREANEELENSLQKIKLLKPQNITEVKNFSNPPQKVKVVNAAMTILILDNALLGSILKKKFDLDEFWKLGKNHLLSDGNKLFQFLTNPETKFKIQSQRIEKAKQLIEEFREFWVDKEIMGASVAMFYIYLWVNSMISFSDINEKSKPIREELEKVTQVLDQKTAVLD